MVMKHAQLKAFHAVAKYGGFTNAAKSLGLTQPAVSHQVQSLERNYGVRLFERSGRHVNLTQTGLHLHSFVKRYFSLEEETHEFLTSITQNKPGKLRIACDMAARVYPLTEKFRAAYSLSEISVSICEPHQIEKNLLDHKVDIAFTGENTTEPLLEYIKIREENITVTGSTGASIGANNPITMEELRNHRILVHENSQGLDPLSRDLIDLACIPKKTSYGLRASLLFKKRLSIIRVYLFCPKDLSVTTKGSSPSPSKTAP